MPSSLEVVAAQEGLCACFQELLCKF